MSEPGWMSATGGRGVEFPTTLVRLICIDLVFLGGVLALRPAWGHLALGGGLLLLVLLGVLVYRFLMEQIREIRATERLGGRFLDWAWPYRAG